MTREGCNHRPSVTCTSAVPAVCHEADHSVQSFPLLRASNVVVLQGWASRLCPGFQALNAHLGALNVDSCKSLGRTLCIDYYTNPCVFLMIFYLFRR